MTAKMYVLYIAFPTWSDGLSCCLSFCCLVQDSLVEEQCWARTVPYSVALHDG